MGPLGRKCQSPLASRCLPVTGVAWGSLVSYTLGLPAWVAAGAERVALYLDVYGNAFVKEQTALYIHRSAIRLEELVR